MVLKQISIQSISSRDNRSIRGHSVFAEYGLAGVFCINRIRIGRSFFIRRIRIPFILLASSTHFYSANTEWPANPYSANIDCQKEWP